ncbi:Sorting nexin-20 [Varanus komodoensis]|uniref:sorting nexin-20 n=1 Tax=Varanus komodoensis TaxID=61221 RepID=UPI001CF7941A|nr:sorting nexin-20 [Varanus komodoensis]XP_044283728.1 sorting nexin-20 [Varanus komodoensis]XP_044283730.1 sorting nexin-20 [Varanus komodoensis]KAF7244687.1 Sorting nexin-20 [Varanus komodoensis]
MEGGQGAPAAGNLPEGQAATAGSGAAALAAEKEGCRNTPSPQENQELAEPADSSGEQDTPNLNSSMTTKELQEYWRKEKRNCREVKVVFEIPSAVIVEKPFSKYVKYQILIVQTGSFDSNRSMIERRYSDFERLHTNLLKEFCDEMEDVTFPKKTLTGNFTEEIIIERKLAFQDYLRLLYSMECTRTSRMFIDFLTRPELEEAYGCLRGGQYNKALEVFLETVALQEKLTKHRPVLLVPTLCAILVCYKDLENLKSAYEFGEKALSRLSKHPSHRYHIPLLETMISLAYGLGKDFVSFQEKMEEEEAKKCQNKAVTLKELAVREYLH